MVVTWKEWSHKFLHGDLQLVPVYYTLLLFMVSAIMFGVSVYAMLGYAIILFFIASLSAYAVFTDEVAHLYPYNITNPITMNDWFYNKFLHFRTHDAYGIIICAVALITGVYYLTMQSTYMLHIYDTVIFAGVICIPVQLIIYNFAFYGFYH